MGHAEFCSTKDSEARLISLLNEFASKKDCEFLFGGYGRFDAFAFQCVKKIVSPHIIKSVFVTPYITESYMKNQLEYAGHIYDEIIYPAIEQVPYRFAINARNKWMAEQGDLIICYIDHPFGGAYNAVKHGLSKKKQIINLGKYKRGRISTSFYLYDTFSFNTLYIER